MLVKVLSRQHVPHQNMEPSLCINILSLLVDHATILRYIPHQSAAIGSRNGLGQFGIIRVEPSLAVVVGVREVNAMIGISVWSFSNRPRSVKLSVEVVQSVDVGIIVVALDVHALSGPFTCGGAVAMDIAVSRSRSVISC